ncbi:MAG: hypothetical protein HW378_3822 [Anaerolineales bacterium]|jgi:photosystem II stability/assembly factor-like uncharacterized protein|nr:hypothetical protein [Anaerolineales bacterium]
MLTRSAWLVMMAAVLLTACGSPATEPPTLAATQSLPTRAPTLAPSPVSPTRAPATQLPLSPSPAPSPATPAASPTAPASTPETGGPAINPIAHLTAGQPVTVTAIHMLDATTGWAVATGGVGDPDDHLLRTTDGGATWRDVTPPENNDPSAPLGKGATAFFLDASAAWVTYYDRTAGPAVSSPVVWRTTDAGQTWAASRTLNVSDGEFYSPSDIVFVDVRTGWLLVHAGAGMMHDYVFVFATSDGGQTWERIVDPFTDTLPQSCGKTAMIFADAQTGWVTGDCQGVQPGAPYLQKTTDGGRTWGAVELAPPADAPELFKTDTTACGTYAPVAFSPESMVVAMQCNDFNTGRFSSFLYTTADGGQTWTIHSLPALFSSATFISAETGWVKARQNDFPEGPSDLYQTLNGGQTFAKIKTLNWLGSQFSFISAQVGWAVARSHEGSALVTTTDGGKTWKEIKPQIAP